MGEFDHATMILLLFIELFLVFFFLLSNWVDNISTLPSRNITTTRSRSIFYLLIYIVRIFARSNDSKNKL